MISRSLIVFIYSSSCSTSQGWEETVESAVCYALRTSLARSKSSDLGTSSNTIGNSTANMDISRLKKRIQTLCERLEKGGSLVASDSYSDRANSTDCTLRRIRLDIESRFLFLLTASYSAGSMSNRKGKTSSSSAGYSSHREMNSHEDEENGLPNDDHGSRCQRIFVTNQPLFDGLSFRYIPSSTIEQCSPNDQRGR